MNGRDEVWDATATAHANIAFSKYWGKRTYPGNYPAVPSLSLTLDAMTTRTRVMFHRSFCEDRLVLNGAVQSGPPLEKMRPLLDRVRHDASLNVGAHVVTVNDFPTASGLASSASGFAALALAAVRAARLPLETPAISDLARRGSASAARSLYGGFVELPAGPKEETAEPLSARPVVPARPLDWRVLVVQTTRTAKAVGSSEGMRTTASESPYYAAWLEEAPRVHDAIKSALMAGDFETFGALSERSALSMHASAIAAGVVYWSGVTLDLLSAVRELRAVGVPAFATVDAGPHVKVLVQGKDVSKVLARIEDVAGVVGTLEAKAAEGATLMDRAPDDLAIECPE